MKYSRTPEGYRGVSPNYEEIGVWAAIWMSERHTWDVVARNYHIGGHVLHGCSGALWDLLHSENKYMEFYPIGTTICPKCGCNICFED